MTNKLKLIFS